MGRKSDGPRPPTPPALEILPLVHASEDVARWLDHYWRKLQLPPVAADHLALTTDRQEFARWTGRRLNPLALGCYCYLPNASGDSPEVGCDVPAGFLNTEAATLTAPALAPAGRLQLTLPGFASAEEDAGSPPVEAAAPSTAARLNADHRHLIFIEPDLLPVSIEVTVAHELIHLSDRMLGHPRKHRCHGYDSISVDEAVLTGHDPEFLRAQLREETARREAALRRVRPYRYLYVCPVCHKEYPRVRRYARPVSCGRCDKRFNLAFVLQPRDLPPYDRSLDPPALDAQPPREDGADSADALPVEEGAAR